MNKNTARTDIKPGHVVLANAVLALDLWLVLGHTDTIAKDLVLQLMNSNGRLMKHLAIEPASSCTLLGKYVKRRWYDCRLPFVSSKFYNHGT